MKLSIRSDTLNVAQLKTIDAVTAAAEAVPIEELGPAMLSIAVVCALECGMSRERFLEAAADTFDNTGPMVSA